jgi:glycosyltransferase involved in cell wall biosynthesis
MFHIVHLVDNLGIGGAQSMMFELYQALANYYPQYPQSIFYTQNNRTDDKFISSYGVPCRYAKNNDWILKKINKRGNVVVIYHKLASSHYKILDLIKSRTSAKVVVINHTLYKSSSWARVKSIDIMVAVSNHMLQAMQHWYPKLNKVCIHNSVGSYKYDAIAPRKANKKGILLTGRVNRICQWKHPTDWANWCKDIKLEKAMVHEYIGNSVGRSRNNVRGQKSKGRNVVNMMGGISDFTTKISIMKDWDVFLYETNKDEGISMAILESLACGVPVVCSDHFGNKEIIEDGVNGYVFKNRKHAAKILNRLVKNPEELSKLKTTTKIHFKEKLDSQYMACKYIKVMEEVMGNNPDKIKEPKQNVEIIDRFKDEANLIESEPSRKEVSVELAKIPEPSRKFSILTSSFDKGEFLYDWSNSILAQKYRPLEVVFANDCSTDNTLEMVEGFKKQFLDSGIEFVLVNNDSRLHCGSSYNDLIKYATGSYFGVLDADDMLVDDSVEYVMKKYDEYNNVTWIYTQFDICDMNMKSRKRGFCCCPKKGESLLDLGNRRVHGFGHWRTFCYRFPRINKIFGKKLKCGVDKFMGYRLEEFGQGMFVDRVCYKYRQHPVGSPKSVSSTKEAINVWGDIKRKASSRRKRYNLKTSPIINCKNI